MINADSIKARLKQYAQNTGHTFQEALTYYVLERTIYRICRQLLRFSIHRLKFYNYLSFVDSLLAKLLYALSSMPNCFSIFFCLDVS